MAMTQLTPEFAVLADQLIAKVAGTVEPDVVRQLVAATAMRFEDVPVRDYVEVLVMKEVGDHLRQLRLVRS